jgi:ABC-type multidrug transport system fused ATPase/permease subunit
LIKIKNNTWLYRVNNLGMSYNEIVIFILLSLSATVTEIFGIGIFLPIFQFIRFEGDVDSLVGSSTLWQYVIDWFAYFNIEISLILLLLMSFTFFLVRQLFTYLRLVYQSALSERIIQMQRNKVFSGYIDADTTYHDKVPVGNLVNLVITEVNRATAAVMIPLELMVYIIMSLGYISVLIIISWEMTIVSMVVLLIASKAPKIWIKKSVITGRNLVKSNSLMSEFLVRRLQSPRLIRLSGTEKEEQKDFYNLTRSQRKHLVFSSILRAKTQVSIEPVVIGLSLIFLYFAYTILHMQIEILGFYLVIALRLMPVIKGIVTQWQSVQQYLGSIEILEDRLKSMQESIEKDTGVEFLNQLNESILIKNVSYCYPKRQDYALKNINIELKSNKLTAIVGPSGSGKSTLIDLLPRLRLPTKGLIQIDGIGIEKYTLKSLRRAISYLSQSPQIFEGTVRSHILYGSVNITDKEIHEAVCLAGAENFINQLPQGIDTILGENEIRLSGGQRQRLDLARVLLRKSPILILDEPTSNLDAKSEEVFKQALYRIRKETNITIVIIAHRLKIISDAYNIIVINKGEVEMSGTHEELMNKGGWYADAWNTQQAENNNFSI